MQHQPNLEPATVASYCNDVRVFCSWLVDEEVLDRNPAHKLAPKVLRRRPASYTPAQLHQLLAVCDLRDQAILVTLLDTGLREAELISMRRDRIDLASGRFTVIGKGAKSA